MEFWQMSGKIGKKVDCLCVAAATTKNLQILWHQSTIVPLKKSHYWTKFVAPTIEIFSTNLLCPAVDAEREPEALLFVYRENDFFCTNNG